MSASFAQATIECHSVFSWRCPSCPVQLREVANLKFATRCPPGVVRTSGSDPRLPTRMTLFTPATIHPQYDEVCVGAFLDDRLPRAPRQAGLYGACAWGPPTATAATIDAPGPRRVQWAPGAGPYRGRTTAGTAPPFGPRGPTVQTPS